MSNNTWSLTLDKSKQNLTQLYETTNKNTKTQSNDVNYAVSHTVYPSLEHL